MKELAKYFPIGEMLSNLLYSHAEIVIHDLKTGKIAALYNAFSKRKVGDDSLLDGINLRKLPDAFPVYVKTNWDGKKLKSSTATLRDANGKPIGLFCVNLDLTQVSGFQEFLNAWMTSQVTAQPKILFQDDWRERINTYVTAYLKKEKMTLKALSKEKKRTLIHALFKEGAFEAKNAADYIAEVLDLSRATIYNYLKEKK